MKKHLIATVLGLSLLASGAAMAAPGDHRGPGPDHRPPAGHVPPPPPRGDYRPLPPPKGPGPSAHAHHVPPPPAMRPGHRPPPPPPFHRGRPLPSHVHTVVVRDWRGHGLRKPPRGHEWRRVDGRYLLVAVTTGIIADIVLHGH